MAALSLPTFLATTATTVQRRIAAASILFVVAVIVATLPFRSLALPVVPGFLPAFGAASCIFDLLTALLLINQVVVGGSRSQAILAASYLFAGLIVIVQVGSFPGILNAGVPAGTNPQTAVYLWMLWHFGFPIGVLAFAISNRLGDAHLREPARAISTAVVVALAALTLATLVATVPWLHRPQLVSEGSYRAAFTYGIAQAVLAASAAAWLTIVVRREHIAIADVWMSVAATAFLGDCILTLFGGARYSLGWYVARFDSLLVGATMCGAFVSEVHALYVAAARVATVDGLTGVANRRALDQRIDAVHRAALRSNATYSIIMIDVDHFKSYNDRYGHLAGDDILRAVALSASTCLTRGEDFVARYGGEEFVVVLDATPLAGAQVVAERVRSTIERTLESYGVTVSLGVASRADSENSQESIAKADRALYEAKRLGRNQTVVAN